MTKQHFRVPWAPDALDRVAATYANAFTSASGVLIRTTATLKA
jgi:hypothetical protein